MWLAPIFVTSMTKQASFPTKQKIIEEEKDFQSFF